jgi:hypothetical protein
MDTVAYERWNETEDVDEKGLLPHASVGQATFTVLDEELLVFCPECFETAETFCLIEHRDWCLYSSPVPPGDF